jgi:hypothetical protein
LKGVEIRRGVAFFLLDPRDLSTGVALTASKTDSPHSFSPLKIPVCVAFVDVPATERDKWADALEASTHLDVCMGWEAYECLDASQATQDDIWVLETTHACQRLAIATLVAASGGFFFSVAATACVFRSSHSFTSPRHGEKLLIAFRKPYAQLRGESRYIPGCLPSYTDCLQLVEQPPESCL